MVRDAIGATIFTLEDNGKKPPKMSKEINVKKGTFSNKGKTIVSKVLHEALKGKIEMF